MAGTAVQVTFKPLDWHHPYDMRASSKEKRKPTPCPSVA